MNCALLLRIGQPGLSCTDKPELVPQPLVMHLQPFTASCMVLTRGCLLPHGFLCSWGTWCALGEDPKSRGSVTFCSGWHGCVWTTQCLLLLSRLHALLPDAAKPDSLSTASAPQPMQIVSSVTAMASCYMWMPKRPHEMGILQVRGRAGSFRVEHPATCIPSGNVTEWRPSVAVHMHALRLIRRSPPIASHRRPGWRSLHGQRETSRASGRSAPPHCRPSPLSTFASTGGWLAGRLATACQLC